MTKTDFQIYPSCCASHGESTLRSVRWRHFVFESRAFCFTAFVWQVTVMQYIIQNNKNHWNHIPKTPLAWKKLPKKGHFAHTGNQIKICSQNKCHHHLSNVCENSFRMFHSNWVISDYHSFVWQFEFPWLNLTNCPLPIWAKWPFFGSFFHANGVFGIWFTYFIKTFFGEEGGKTHIKMSNTYQNLQKPDNSHACLWHQCSPRLHETDQQRQLTLYLNRFVQADSPVPHSQPLMFLPSHCSLLLCLHSHPPRLLLSLSPLSQLKCECLCLSSLLLFCSKRFLNWKGCNAAIIYICFRNETLTSGEYFKGLHSYINVNWEVCCFCSGITLLILHIVLKKRILQIRLEEWKRKIKTKQKWNNNNKTHTQNQVPYKVHQLILKCSKELSNTKTYCIFFLNIAALTQEQFQCMTITKMHVHIYCNTNTNTCSWNQTKIKSTIILTPASWSLIILKIRMTALMKPQPSTITLLQKSQSSTNNNWGCLIT